MTKDEYLKKIANESNDKFSCSHDFVKTSPCGRGEHHPHGLIGKMNPHNTNSQNPN